MDFILDAYFFKFFPFEVSQSTKKTIGDKAMDFIIFFDWILRTQDVRKIWAENASLLAVELILPFLCQITLIHAVRHGARYIYTWFTILLLGLIVENVRFLDPHNDIIWYSPGVSTLFGMRTPVYVIFGMYHVLLYSAYVMSRRLRLKWWAEGPACGISVLLISFPLHLMGNKLLWWTWHDDDPYLRERLYSSPWIMFAFDVFVGSSFIFTQSLSKKIVCLLSHGIYHCNVWITEFFLSIITVIVSIYLALFQLCIFICVPHIFLGIEMSTLVSFVIAVHGLIIITADRNNTNNDSRPKENEKRFWFDELASVLCIYYLFLMVLTLVTQPGEIMSEGIHQSIGPCTIAEPAGKFENANLTRQKYLCVTRYRADNFDFNCLPKVPEQILHNEPLEWYRICGKDFLNRYEYIFIIWGFSFISLFIFYQIGARSGRTPLDPLIVRSHYTCKAEDNLIPQQITMEEQDPLDFLAADPTLSFSEMEASEMLETNITNEEFPMERMKETEVDEREGKERVRSRSIETRSSTLAKRRSIGGMDSLTSLLPTPKRVLRNRKAVK